MCVYVSVCNTEVGQREKQLKLQVVMKVMMKTLLVVFVLPNAAAALQPSAAGR